MKPIFLFILLILMTITHSGHSASVPPLKCTISGKDTDKNEGECIVVATVNITELRTDTTTEPYGRFSITIPEEKYIMSVPYFGYSREVRDIILDKNIRFKLELVSEHCKLQQAGIRNPFFSGLPANVESNISNGTIRFFMAYSNTFAKFVIS